MKKNQFSRWCASQKADSMELLRELILLEDFKKSVPVAVATYLNEQRVATLAHASVLADEFVLTHRGMQDRYSGDQGRFRVPDKGRVTRPNPVTNPRGHRNLLDLNSCILCFYCKKSGHKISECHALKKRKFRSVGFEKAKEDKSEKTKIQKLKLKELSVKHEATLKQNGDTQLQVNRLKQEVLEKEQHYERELKSFKIERKKLLGEASKRDEDLQILSKQLEEQLVHKTIERVVKETSESISSLEQQLEKSQEDSPIGKLGVEPKAPDLDKEKLAEKSKIKIYLKNVYICLLMPVTVLVLYISSWAQMGLNIRLWVIPLWRRRPYPSSWQYGIMRFIWVLPLILLRSTPITGLWCVLTG